MIYKIKIINKHEYYFMAKCPVEKEQKIFFKSAMQTNKAICTSCHTPFLFSSLSKPEEDQECL